MVNDTRSLTADLREGITDGVVKKIDQNRGGEVSSAADQAAMWNVLPQDRYNFSYSASAAKAVADRVTKR